MHAITCASSPAPPRSTLKQGYMGSVHVWEGSAARAARRERGRGLPNREGATSGGNTCWSPFCFPSAGYSADKIPNDNQDLTFDGDLHDVAVLKLAKPVPDAVTVTLADGSLEMERGQRLKVVGWGKTEAGQSSQVLE